VVYHFAALVGVGQSMYEIVNYTDVNNVGTANLLDQISKNPIKKLIVASSMSIYGEGLYTNQQNHKVEDAIRTLDDLKNGEWELYDEFGPLAPVPTPEEKIPDLSSVYALSKYDQEKLCLLIGKAYNIPTVALRFFNVYGPYQSLSNPYTGVLAIFASRLLNEKAPMIFEDGLQKRDFVNVKDVARGCRLALENEQITHDVFNIGSGEAYSILELAQKMAQSMGKEYIQPEITGKYRHGDIRHCFADISRASRLIGYQPEVTLRDGMIELADWLKDQVAIDNVSTMRKELETRGLAV